MMVGERKAARTFGKSDAIDALAGARGRCASRVCRGRGWRVYERIRRAGDTCLVDALDRLDSSRYDVSELVDRANAFEALPSSEQDQTTFWEFTGFDQAQHVLSALLPELHNTRLVVRDLDGSLRFVFEDLDAHVHGGTVWNQAELIRENLVDDDEVADLLMEADVDLEVVREVLRDLPSDPRHSLSF
jgi:hypothetical protein